MLAMCICLTIQAQSIIYWTGGTPGVATQWDNPQNWIPNRIPSTYDLVVIPDCTSKGGFYPELTKTVAPIAHLRVESGAVLTIRPGAQLTIDGSTTFNDGIALYGAIRNEGQIFILNAGLEDLDNHSGHFINYGLAVMSPRDTKNQLAKQ